VRIRAAAAFERKDPNAAVELLKQTSGIELGATNPFVTLVPVICAGKPISRWPTATKRQENFKSLSTIAG
jgi:hypothetical protein